MAIDNLFTKEEQIDILWEVRKIKKEFEEQSISAHRKFYFSRLADQWGLIERMFHQLAVYKPEMDREAITTNQEVADLFGVSISTVDSYLTRRISSIQKSERGVLCLRKGQHNGWEYLKNSGKLHTLTAEDKTKPKKYYGRKRSNKNYRTS